MHIYFTVRYTISYSQVHQQHVQDQVWYQWQCSWGFQLQKGMGCLSCPASLHQTVDRGLLTNDNWDGEVWTQVCNSPCWTTSAHTKCTCADWGGVSCALCPSESKSNNVLNWSHVFHLKVLWQLSFDFVKMWVTVASHELIINIDWNVDFDGALLVHIKAWIDLRPGESHVVESLIQLYMPMVASLWGSIDCFVESCHLCSPACIHWEAQCRPFLQSPHWDRQIWSQLGPI